MAIILYVFMVHLRAYDFGEERGWFQILWLFICRFQCESSFGALYEQNENLSHYCAPHPPSKLNVNIPPKKGRLTPKNKGTIDQAMYPDY